MQRVAVTVGTEEALPQALVVFRGLEQSIPQISRLGFDGLEIAVFQESNVDRRKLRGLLESHNLQVPVFSTGQISRVHGLHFSDPDADVRDRAVEIFRGVVDLAGDFGADINVSLVRGRLPENYDRSESLGWVGDCLAELCRHAERYGVNLVLEQMNRYETNYWNSAAEIADYIRATGIANLKLHADTFHMNIEDRHIAATIEDVAPVLGYIHFADSNRLAPGSGHLDFPGILAALDRSGYTGWIGLEVLRVPDGFQAAKTSIEYLRGLSRG